MRPIRGVQRVWLHRQAPHALRFSALPARSQELLTPLPPTSLPVNGGRGLAMFNFLSRIFKRKPKQKPKPDYVQPRRPTGYGRGFSPSQGQPSQSADPMSLSNPLNPLSPFSPVNQFDSYEPSRSHSSSCSSHSRSDHGSHDSGSSYSSSDSCSSSSSSDSSSSYSSD